LKPYVTGRAKNKLLSVKVMGNPNKEEYFFSDQICFLTLCQHRITIYDALFVAASIRSDAPLVTADTKLAGAVRETCQVIRIG